MSRYAQFDEDGNQYQFASNQGWSEFGDWIESLDEDTYPQLHELWDNGTTQAIAETIEQLEHALEENPPSDNVAASADLLLTALHSNTNSNTLLITQ